MKNETDNMRSAFIPTALAITAALAFSGCNESADHTEQRKAAERSSMTTTPAPVVTTDPAMVRPSTMTDPTVMSVQAPRPDDKARTFASADVVSPGAKPIPPENGPKLVTAETYPMRDANTAGTVRDANTDNGMGKDMSSSMNKDVSPNASSDRDIAVVNPALRSDGTPVTAVEPVPRKVDNSGQNDVDKGGHTMTPMDQGSSEADIGITRAIRKELTGDSNLSTNAQNLKVITSDSVVVLRGPVASQVEADAVLAHVRNVQGITRVENQIAVP